MRKFLNIFIICLVLVGLGVSASIGLGLFKEDKNTITVEDWEFENYNAEYEVNEVFSIESLKLNLTMSDGTNRAIKVTEDMIKNVPDMTEVGGKTIIVEFEGKKYSFEINVVEEKGIVKSYTFEGVANSYNYKNPFTTDGVKLNLTLANGKVETVDVKEEMVEAMPDMSTEGIKSVIVIYQGKYYVLNIRVRFEEPIYDYSFAGALDTYNLNQEFVLDNIKLTIVKSDDLTEIVRVTEDMVKQMPDMSTEGEKEVVILYGDYEYRFTIKVEYRRIVIAYAFNNCKSTYFTRESFSIKGASLNIYYDDNCTEVVALDDSMIVELPEMTVAGNKKVEIKVQENIYEININVNEFSYDVEEYAFVGVNNYIVESEFDPSGIKLVVVAKDGSTAVVSVTDDMVKEIPDMSKVGTKNIIINYGAGEYKLEINVILEKAVVQYSVGSNQCFEGHEFTLDGCWLTLYYEDGTLEDISLTDDMITKWPNMNVEGWYEAAVEYQGIEYTFEVYVWD